MNQCKDCKHFHYDQEVGSLGWGSCSYINSGEGLVRNPDVFNADTQKYESTRIFVHTIFGCNAWEKKGDGRQETL